MVAALTRHSRETNNPSFTFNSLPRNRQSGFIISSLFLLRSRNSAARRAIIAASIHTQISRTLPARDYANGPDGPYHNPVERAIYARHSEEDEETAKPEKQAEPKYQDQSGDSDEEYLPFRARPARSLSFCSRHGPSSESTATPRSESDPLCALRLVSRHFVPLLLLSYSQSSRRRLSSSCRSDNLPLDKPPSFVLLCAFLRFSRPTASTCFPTPTARFLHTAYIFLLPALPTARDPPSKNSRPTSLCSSSRPSISFTARGRQILQIRSFPSTSTDPPHSRPRDPHP